MISYKKLLLKWTPSGLDCNVTFIFYLKILHIINFLEKGIKNFKECGLTPYFGPLKITESKSKCQPFNSICKFYKVVKHNYYQFK